MKGLIVIGPVRNGIRPLRPVVGASDGIGFVSLSLPKEDSITPSTVREAQPGATPTER